jgi:hypothetical protein
MFRINEDLSIACTRGDVAVFSVGANIAGQSYVFKSGDVVRFTVYVKKDCSEVVLQKDTTVSEETEAVEIELSSKDTKIGDTISKPVVYWYEVELNPETRPQTIVGYDEDGAKEFKLYPEAEV